MTAGQVRAVSLPMLGRAAWAGAQTLYWGGGASDIAGPQALPTEPGDLAGTWNTTLRNRATDSAGTTCQPWSNSGTNRTALIGHGLATDTADATIALGDSVALNTLDISDAKGSANKKVRFATFPDSPVAITLNGAAPTVDLRGGINREAVFPAAVSWSGTSGLRFRTTGTDQGWLTLHGDASALTGTLEGLGGLYSRAAGRQSAQHRLPAAGAAAIMAAWRYRPVARETGRERNGTRGAEFPSPRFPPSGFPGNCPGSLSSGCGAGKPAVLSRGGRHGRVVRGMAEGSAALPMLP
jgi:hypothetical protein